MGVEITYQNGQLGQIAGTQDGLCALLILTDKTILEANTDLVCYDGTNIQDAVIQIKNATDLVNEYGVDPESENDEVLYLYQQVVEFYLEAGNGAPIYLMAMDHSSSIKDVTDPVTGELINLYNYDPNIKFGGVCLYDADFTVTTAGGNGFDDLSFDSISQAHTLVENNFLTSAKQQPMFTIIEGKAFQGTESDLTDLTLSSNNRAGVTLWQTTEMNAIDPESASVGLLLGRIASVHVGRKISRTGEGPLAITGDMYLSDGSTLIEDSDFETIAARAYITATKYPFKNGYFPVNSSLATAKSDDYSGIEYRRVADKVHRLSYKVYIDEVDDEILLAEDGTLDPLEAKSLEQLVISEVEAQMVNIDTPELSGFSAFVDTNQDVVTNEKITISENMQTLGYKGTIAINLGFSKTS